MNKVVSIEIAGQVFWIEEEAYDALRDYLKKIKIQLSDDECAEEIFQDIELRIAELLFVLNSDKQKAIVLTQLNEVLDQVGFIDDAEQEVEAPRKSFRDPRNKILGGVCSGLAVRWGIPAFIIRLAFLGLTAFFGIGIALYLIFWISLDTSNDRNTTLEAHGKAKTARQIATFEAPKDSTLVKLQRILFLPISILGTLLSVIGNHFINRKGGYVFILKNIFAAFLIVVFLIIGTIATEFYASHIFPKLVSGLLSMATFYLLILLLAIYIREYYMTESLRKVDKRLKVGSIIPIVMIIIASSYMIKQQSDNEHQLVNKQFVLEKKNFAVKIDESSPQDQFYGNVKFKVRTNSSSNKVNLIIDYSSNGSNEVDALENARDIDFYFSFSNGVLEMRRYWTLKEGAYNRGQSVYVTVEVPQHTQVLSSRRLTLMEFDGDYEYWAGYAEGESLKYLVSDEYIHELQKEYANKLSDNELEVLTDKFCEEYFIAESWSCDSNIRREIVHNAKFDRAFNKDMATIEQLRQFMQSDRSLFVASLSEMLKLVESISIQYPVKNEFHLYLEHLQKVKSNTMSVSLVNSG